MDSTNPQPPSTTPSSSSTTTTASNGDSPIELLPSDALHQIFSLLPLPQALHSRILSRHFLHTLSSPSFLSLLPPHPLLLLRPRHHPPYPHHPLLHAYSPSLNHWLSFPLSFLPPSPHPPLPVSSSPHGLLLCWLSKTLILCNPLTRSFKPLPQLGSAWSKHGTVLSPPHGQVLVLSELAVLCYSPGLDRWRRFPSDLPSKPRSPVVVKDDILVLCDVSPWRSQWRLFMCSEGGKAGSFRWRRLERVQWGDVMDCVRRPRLVRGTGRTVLMIGGLRSSYAMESACSTVVILRLDLGTLEWDEAGRMPGGMFGFLGGGEGGGKVKVFGGDGRVWFSGKEAARRLAMWEEVEGVEGGRWRWVEGVPAVVDGPCRGFVMDASVTAVP
ncbi:SKP1-interacting partner 15 [Acorus calamus]|uniref:SKP1-interacting partner 15 n=1 Tax=Acorus calamus TaxID=4465 RepID=A0AAV9ECF6_ACOCL|nr:SKP1-interacting partner 15 [Acorus calamus]